MTERNGMSAVRADIESAFVGWKTAIMIQSNGLGSNWQRTHDAAINEAYARVIAFLDDIEVSDRRIAAGMFWSVCTKCGHFESGESVLSRFCPQCSYMRGVRRNGETPEEAAARDSAPWSDEELARVTVRPIPALNEKK